MYINFLSERKRKHLSFFLSSLHLLSFYKAMSMEFSTYWHSFFTSPLLFPYPFLPENYVHWIQTPDSHVYSADIPGVKKEEIRVEVEDSRYLIIRTEVTEESTTEQGRSFLRKFRLPETNAIDLNGISAGYEDGVLTVTVPRLFISRGIFICPDDLSEQVGALARAA